KSTSNEQRRYPTRADQQRLSSTHSGPLILYKADSQRIRLVGDRGEHSETREQCATIHHSINSACTRSDCGIVRPSALAVLVAMTRSNFVGSRTGRSAGPVFRPAESQDFPIADNNANVDGQLCVQQPAPKLAAVTSAVFERLQHWHGVCCLSLAAT